MGQAMTDRLTGLRAGNARGALLGAASLVVVAVAVALVLAGVTSGEVAATVLFLPVFAAGFVGGRPAGYAGAAVATLLYIAVRRDDLSSAGVASAGVLTLTRAAAYLVVGHVGALAQALAPDGSARAGAPGSRPGRTAAGPAGRRPAGQRYDDSQPQRRPEPAWDQMWDDDRVHATAIDRREPVLAGVASPAAGRDPYAGVDGYGAPPPTTTMSGAWPPEPPREPWRDEPQSGRPSRDGGHDAGGWDDAGAGGWPADDGWPGEGTGQGPAPTWQAGDESHPLEDDSWAAVQQSWRQQHGVPVEDERGAGAAGGGADGWAYEPQRPYEPQASGDGWKAPAPVDPWNDTRSGHAVPGVGGPPAEAWPAAPSTDDGWAAPADTTAAPSDPWADAAPTGGTWPQPPGAGPGAGDGWPGAPAPADTGWPAPPVAAADGAWDAAAPPAAPWDAPPPPSAPWNAPPPPPGPNGWDGPQGDTWQSTGQTEAVWDDPAAGHGQQPEQWAAPAEAPHTEMPAVDPETGLWTAKFLRDRLSSERARNRRTGRSFSLVLVQVPDGPLAQLPYRRQLTLLRELGYQFVAGGVVDHLVHVPDQAQHWFAVILPDTDRSGAQVLERRLRLGIGGYLSSRGLRLRDLESASLTAPDDDPAMGAIWEALIGPDEPGSSMSNGY